MSPRHSRGFTLFNYINGSFDSNSNGVFTANFGLQFTTDGTSWTASGWSFTPTYAYDSSAAGKVTYTFTGNATSVLGVRAVGQVHASDNSNSWHANAYELQAYGSASAPTNTPTTAPTNTSAPTNTTAPTTGGSDGTPYGGTAAVIPGRVEVANFNLGGEGVAYHDLNVPAHNTTNPPFRTSEGVDLENCTDTGCGYNIGWVIAGEWTKYTVNVQTSGTYDIAFRVASTKTTGSMHLEVDGTNVTGVLAVPNTTGWQIWTNLVKSGVSLTAGQHVLRLVSDTAGENYYYIDFALSGGTTNTPVNTATSAPTNTVTATLTGSVPPTNTSTSTPTKTATFVPPTFTSTSVPTNTPTSGSGGPTATIPADTANTFVRINQVGYMSGDAKIAILQASSVVTGTFKVVSTTSNTVLFTGTIPSSMGSWSTTFPDNYKLDFSSVTTPGMYYIQVTGSATTHSFKFKIDSPANIYMPLVANGLFYYQAQRDGPNTINVIGRKPSHLNDEKASIYNDGKFSTDGNDTLLSDLTKIGGPVDVSGGWFDAGDFLKFLYTASYTNALMMFAVREHPTELGGGGSINLVGEAQFGADWVQKMWDDNTKTLYYQVGLGGGNSSIAGDHDIWRLPEVDDTMAATIAGVSNKYLINRPVFRANTPGGTISPNMAGRVVADLALCYQVFYTSNVSYANKCLVDAEHIYALANTTNPGSTMLTTNPHDFYTSDETWHSDMEFGAVELYNALHAAGSNLPSGLPQTNPTYYLTQSATWANDSMSDAQDSLNLYHVDGLADYELYKAIGQAGGSGLAVSQSTLIGRIKSHITGAISGASGDPFGQGFTSNDITPHDLGLAVEAHLYDNLTNSTTYRSFEASKLDWALGKNAWGSSYIVGDGTVFPNCMQHEVANLGGSLNGTSPLMLGATVDGPNTPASGLSLQDGMRTCPVDGVDHFKAFNAHSLTYIDNVISWPNSEPADDYTIVGVVAFAQQLP